MAKKRGEFLRSGRRGNKFLIATLAGVVIIAAGVFIYVEYFSSAGADSKETICAKKVPFPGSKWSEYQKYCSNTTINADSTVNGCVAKGDPYKRTSWRCVVTSYLPPIPD